LRRVCDSGARLAEPGEFTLRAFLSGRLDLTQAEAVLAVVDAADPGQFDVALAQLAGGLAGPLHDLRERLLELLAHLEAGLDFPDEDLPFIDRDELTGTLAGAAETVATLARQMAERGETADRVRVVLVGWPNTGKSSLFNALAGRAGALVSEEPGTTRDYLTAEMEIEGARCLVVDTAGVEPSPAAPEADLRHAAQASTREQTGRADLRVLCLDATRPLNAWERGQLASDDANRIVVLTKVDLPRRTDYAGRSIATSSVTGEGIERLRGRLGEAVLTLGASGGDVVPSTAVRCGESLRLAAAGLRRAVDLAKREAGEELVAVEVRLALESLGKTVGAVYTDDVLDRVFSRFCIGK
jgi:tRNA modification GTPase